MVQELPIHQRQKSFMLRLVLNQMIGIIQLSMKYNDDVSINDTNTDRTESATIFDFNGSMNLDGMGMAGSSAFLNIDNVFDKTYIASAHNTDLDLTNHVL